MNNSPVLRAGKPTVCARVGQFTKAVPEALTGRTDGPVGQAFTRRTCTAATAKQAHSRSGGAQQQTVGRSADREPPHDQARYGRLELTHHG